MSRTWIIALGLCLSASPALAQNKAGEPTAPKVGVSSSQVAATPEMWFYEQQLRLWNDPDFVVRANSRYRMMQRMRRQESMAWFGLSNARPTVSADPMYGEWSPTWAGNTQGQPYLWSGWGRPWVVVQRPVTVVTR